MECPKSCTPISRKRFLQKGIVFALYLVKNEDVLLISQKLKVFQLILILSPIPEALALVQTINIFLTIEHNVHVWNNI